MFSKVKKYSQGIIIQAFIILLAVFCQITMPKGDAQYADTAYTVGQIQNTVNAIAHNRARLQQYMYTRYPKVPELDWENPDEITFDSATWKFRWLSHDWYFIAQFDMRDLTLKSMQSYEDLSNEQVESN